MTQHFFRLRWLAALNTLSFTGFQLILVTLYPYTAEQTGLSLATVIACFSAGSFCFLFAGPFWASRGDRVGQQKVIIIGLAGIFISFLALVLLLQFGSNFTPLLTGGALLLSRLFYGLTAASVVPSSQALQAELAPGGNQMKAMFTHSMSLNLGRAFGPLLVLLSGARVNILLTASLLWLAGLIAINMLAPKLDFHLKAAVVSAGNILKLNTREIFGKIIWIFAVALLVTIFIEMLNSSLAATLKTIFVLQGLESSQLIAKILLACSAIIIGTQVISRSWFALHWRQGFIFGALFLLIGALTFKEMSAPLHLWAAMACFSVSIGLLPPSYLALLNEINTGSGNRGKKAGLISIAHALGYAVGGAGAAFILKIKVISIDSALLTLAVMIAVALYVSAKQSQVTKASAPIQSGEEPC